MPAFQRANHPSLVLIRGLPGSGKSYLATALQESLGADQALVLDPDKIDLTSSEYLAFSAALTKEGVDQKFHPYRWSRAQAYDAIDAHKVVIWNQAFTNLDGFNKTIINLQGYATDHGTHLPLLVVEVEVDHGVAKDRVAARAAQGGHDVPRDAFDRFINDYRSFSDEGFTTVVVNGEDDIAVSVASVKRALQGLQN
jgi:predicted ABC-type ATPase